MSDPGGTADAFRMGMLDIVLCILALLAGGMVLELFAASRAPLGYQDENGFHFGTPAKQGPDVSVLSVSSAKPARSATVVAAPAHFESVSPA